MIDEICLAIHSVHSWSGCCVIRYWRQISGSVALGIEDRKSRDLEKNR